MAFRSDFSHFTVFQSPKTPPKLLFEEKKLKKSLAVSFIFLTFALDLCKSPNLFGLLS